MKSRTEDSIHTHPVHPGEEGLLLASLTVAPRRCLHMAQEKAGYKRRGLVSQRNV